MHNHISHDATTQLSVASHGLSTRLKGARVEQLLALPVLLHPSTALHPAGCQAKGTEPAQIIPVMSSPLSLYFSRIFWRSGKPRNISCHGQKTKTDPVTITSCDRRKKSAPYIRQLASLCTSSCSWPCVMQLKLHAAAAP